MSEFSGFFDAHLVDGKYDRAYLAEHFAKYFASFIGNGVFGGSSDELIVLQRDTANMSVKVSAGTAFINGYFYENDEELILSLDTADGVLNRIDLIVLRFDNTERVIRLFVKKGIPATNAIAPTLQRDSDFYELKLAEINIKAGATSITQMNITDTRLNSEVCGFVMGLIKQLDMTSLGIQIDSFIRKFEEDNIIKMEEVLNRLNAMADDNDVASLIFDIENLEDADKKMSNEIVNVKDALGYVRKNLIAYPYVQTTKEEAGITWTDNGDGTLTVNGKVNEVSRFILNPTLSLNPGKYIISSGLSATSDYFIFMEKVSKNTGTGSGEIYYSHNANTFEITEQDVELYNFYVSAVVANNVLVTDITFKPMIYKVEFFDGTWEPYKQDVDTRIKNIAIEDFVNKGCFYRIDPESGEKEWINPPVITGIEYRTTERWNGKPVYKKNVWLGSLPNTDVMAVKVAANYDKIVSISGYAINNNDKMYYPFPIIIDTSITPSAAIVRIEDVALNDGWIAIRTTANMTNFIGYVDVKYVKS